MAFRIIQPNYIGGPPAGSTLLSGLVAAYSLNEGDTGPWVDDGPNGWDITGFTGTSSEATSRTGSGVTYYSVDPTDHIYEGGSSGIFNMQSFTVAHWLKLISITNNPTAAICCFGGGTKNTTASCKFFTYADYSRFGVRLTGLTDNQTDVETELGAMVIGEWHLWIATYDATTGDVALYRDDGTSNWSGNSGFTTLSSYENGIGIAGNNSSSTLGKSFFGHIEDVFIWNRVLSASERAEFWNSGSGVKFGDL